MKEDILNVEILEDGTVKIESPGSISSANHSSADAAFRFIAAMMGGVTTKEKMKEAHSDVHTHTHETHKH